VAASAQAQTDVLVRQLMSVAIAGRASDVHLGIVRITDLADAIMGA
jgi:hypothetical protein